MSQTVKLTLGEKTIVLPVVVGSEGEHAVDITKMRDETGYITLDPGYRNTGSTLSNITFIDAEAGILRYRGQAIEDLAAKCSFLETGYLLIYGKSPTAEQRKAFVDRVNANTVVDEKLLSLFNAFPNNANPMAMLSAAINGLCGYHPEVLDVKYEPHFDNNAAQLLGK
ncbi:MAG TPA: citrate/2-methylcitrate synthase, partial [Tepidisphaeraceae bacterium]